MMSPSAPCPSPGKGSRVFSPFSQLKPVVEPGCRARAWIRLVLLPNCTWGLPGRQASFLWGMFKIKFRAHGQGIETIGGRQNVSETPVEEKS